MTEVETVRLAIIEALPRELATHGEEPAAGGLYVPPAHVKALRLKCNLVVGARGVGKSFWTAAFGSATLRNAVWQSIRELERTAVRIGFAVAGRIDAYQNDETFTSLLAQEIRAYDVWRAGWPKCSPQSSHVGAGGR